MKLNDARRLRRFANIFKFIDDLAVLNDDGEIGRSFREIYTPEWNFRRKMISAQKILF